MKNSVVRLSLMEQFLWKVVDVFQIDGRGVIVTADVRECDECADVPNGYILQIRRPDKTRLDCPVFSIGFIDPPNRERPRHFCLTGDFDKSTVPIGSELWCIQTEREPAT